MTTRIQSALFFVALMALALVTVASYQAVSEQERDAANDDADAVAATAAASTATILSRALEALAGASSVARPDGTIDLQVFETFARDVTDGGSLDNVGLVVIVEAEDRDAFEAERGFEIQAVAPGGQTSDAPPGDEYFPMLALRGDAETELIEGLDYLSDPGRRAAVERARETGAAVVSEPITLAGSGQRGVVVVHPVQYTGARREVVGFLVSPLPVDAVRDRLVETLPEGTDLSLRDRDLELFTVGEPDGRFARAVPVEVPGSEWKVIVEPPVTGGRALSTLALVGDVAVWLAVLGLFLVTLRHQRHLHLAYESVAAAEQRSRSLEQLTARLSQSLSGVEVGDALLDSLRALTGASGGAVCTWSNDGEASVEAVAFRGYTRAGSERLTRVPIEEGSILDEVMNQGEAVYLSSPLAWRDDDAASQFADVGMAAAFVPLIDAGEVKGLLVSSQPSVRRFEPDERSLLGTIGTLAGQALSRGLRYDVEHRASVAFQRASLPATLPEVEGLLMAARYRPATTTSSVGGDWYDAFVLGGGQVALVVGDVVGHGVQAAASMGHLRSAVRVLAGAIPDPDILLRALNPEIAAIPGAVCATMAYGVLDPVSGVFSYVLAGHPPPLVLRADGGTEVLGGQPLPPLGVAPAVAPEAHTVELGPGDTIVFYTDGVVERRAENLTIGFERLATVAAGRAGLDIEDFCDALLDDMVPVEGQADDVAIVALRRQPAEG